MTDLSSLDAVALSQRIQARQLSPVALAEALLDRIARLNPGLNAFVTLAPDALAAAREAEAELAAGRSRGPLQGIPVGHKDLYATQGLKTTAASRQQADNVPAEDVRLVAATSSLVARADTHPAILQLFVQAAQRIHGGTGWFARARQFPIGQDPERPLAPEAERFYRSGAPVLQRYLPFWLANLVDRMWVALFSIIAVLIPLSRLVPPLYEFRVRSRIFRWYRNLRLIEAELERGEASREELLASLERLEGRAAHVTVPLSYADELYVLRQHIELVRARLQKG